MWFFWGERHISAFESSKDSYDVFVNNYTSQLNEVENYVKLNDSDVELILKDIFQKIDLSTQEWIMLLIKDLDDAKEQSIWTIFQLFYIKKFLLNKLFWMCNLDEWNFDKNCKIFYEHFNQAFFSDSKFLHYLLRYFFRDITIKDNIPLDQNLIDYLTSVNLGEYEKCSYNIRLFRYFIDNCSRWLLINNDEIFISLNSLIWVFNQSSYNLNIDSFIEWILNKFNISSDSWMDQVYTFFENNYFTEDFLSLIKEKLANLIRWLEYSLKDNNAEPYWKNNFDISKNKREKMLKYKNLLKIINWNRLSNIVSKISFWLISSIK
jgi:hypothetical protein